MQLIQKSYYHQPKATGGEYKLKPLKRIPTTDPDLSKVQDSVVEVLNDLSRQQLLNYVIIQDLTVSTSVTSVSHTLGRVPTGFMIVKSNADLRVWEPSTSVAPKQLINIQANASGIVSLLIF